MQRECGCVGDAGNARGNAAVMQRNDRPMQSKTKSAMPTRINSIITGMA